MKRTVLCVAVVLLSCGFVLGQQYKVLYSFAGTQAGDGAYPVSNLVFDRSGNLYGTTWFGGSNTGCGTNLGCGTVFKLSPNKDGAWTETVLYNFCGDVVNSQCLDGQDPKAGLIFDAKGNLYGTTADGGAHGSGTVFELSPPSLPGGAWTETVLYTFCSSYSNNTCLDGAAPLSQLTIDAAGNLYGTTSTGGTGGTSSGCCYGGTVFELSPGPSGWTETVLYNFCAAGHNRICPDGVAPQAGVTFDKLGSLYGTTEAGGLPNSQGPGTVYKLSPGSNGWTESVLLTSKQSISGAPLGTVTFDPLGNLYSAFSAGGQNGFGGVFQLRPRGGSTEFSFNGDNGDGPAAGVLIDAKHGTLYGTTSGGSSFHGTVFKMVAPAQLTVLYNFCSQTDCTDGDGPLASLIKDESGSLYGTAKYGGTSTNCTGGCGVVFEIVQSFPKQKARQQPLVWHAILPYK